MIIVKKCQNLSNSAGLALKNNITTFTSFHTHDSIYKKIFQEKNLNFFSENLQMIYKIFQRDIIKENTRLTLLKLRRMHEMNGSHNYKEKFDSLNSENQNIVSDVLYEMSKREPAKRNFYKIFEENIEPFKERIGENVKVDHIFWTELLRIQSDCEHLKKTHRYAKGYKVGIEQYQKAIKNFSKKRKSTGSSESIEKKLCELLGMDWEILKSGEGTAYEINFKKIESKIKELYFQGKIEIFDEFHEDFIKNYSADKLFIGYKDTSLKAAKEYAKQISDQQDKIFFEGFWQYFSKEYSKCEVFTYQMRKAEEDYIDLCYEQGKSDIYEKFWDEIFEESSECKNCRENCDKEMKKYHDITRLLNLKLVGEILAKKLDMDVSETLIKKQIRAFPFEFTKCYNILSDNEKNGINRLIDILHDKQNP